MTDEQIRDYTYPGVFRRGELISPEEAKARDTVSYCESLLKGTYERHTVDIDRKSMQYQAPSKSSGAVWAWIAMGALAALYCVWRFWK